MPGGVWQRRQFPFFLRKQMKKSFPLRFIAFFGEQLTKVLNIEAGNIFVHRCAPQAVEADDRANVAQSLANTSRIKNTSRINLDQRRVSVQWDT